MNWKIATVLKLLTVLDLVRAQYCSVISKIWSGCYLLWCEFVVKILRQKENYSDYHKSRTYCCQEWILVLFCCFLISSRAIPWSSFECYTSILSLNFLFVISNYIPLSYAIQISFYCFVFVTSWWISTLVKHLSWVRANTSRAELPSTIGEWFTMRNAVML